MESLAVYNGVHLRYCTTLSWPQIKDHYSEPLKKKNLERPPPTASAIASFWNPLPSAFPLPSVEGMDIIWNYTLSYGLASISNRSMQARYQRAKKPSVKLTILEESLPELSVWRWVKGWLKATTSVLSPLVLMIRKKRGERDPALKVTDNGGGRQLGLYSINWCLCVGHWPSKWKSKFLMPATVVFSGHTVNTGSTFKALSH